MQCKKCAGKLKVERRCRQVRLKCQTCQEEYKIHEVASQLDSETEAELSKYTTIIYD